MKSCSILKISCLLLCAVILFPYPTSSSLFSQKHRRNAYTSSNMLFAKFFVLSVQLVPKIEDVTENVLIVKADGKILKISFPDILCIEALKKYTSICLTGKKVMTLQSIKKIEEVLPSSQFIRIHKSFMVAIENIDYVERNRNLF